MFIAASDSWQSVGYVSAGNRWSLRSKPAVQCSSRGSRSDGKVRKDPACRKMMASSFKHLSKPRLARQGCAAQPRVAARLQPRVSGMMDEGSPKSMCHYSSAIIAAAK